MRFEVGTKALRQALTAVVPVASSKTDSLARVRFEVAEHTVFISATDAYAAIVAEIGVEVWDGHPGGAAAFELPTVDVKKVLDVHRMPKGDGVVEEDVHLMVTITDESWRSEDTSGLFSSAEALEMPLAPRDAARADVVGMIGESVHAFMEAAGGAETLTFEHAPLSISLAAFDKAQKAYASEPMILRLLPNRRSALVTIGSDVIGLVSTHDITADLYRDHEKGAEWMRAWDRWGFVLPDERRADLVIAGPEETAPTERPADDADGQGDDAS